VATDAAGKIYVADALNCRVQVLSNRGPIASYGGCGNGPGQFSLVYGVAVDGAGNIYLSDIGHDTITKLSPDGKVLAVWGSFGSDPGQFRVPYALAIDSAGDVYVADTFNQRVQKLSPDGKVLAEWGGSSGDMPSITGRFVLPEAIAVDSHDNVYVGDNGRGVVLKYSPSGTLLQQFTVPGPRNDTTGLAVDAAGNAYVTNAHQSVVIEFASTGEIEAVWR
jgi:tripartite motif-containing protein 71